MLGSIGLVGDEGLIGTAGIDIDGDARAAAADSDAPRSDADATFAGGEESGRLVLLGDWGGACASKFCPKAMAKMLPPIIGAKETKPQFSEKWATLKQNNQP